MVRIFWKGYLRQILIDSFRSKAADRRSSWARVNSSNDYQGSTSLLMGPGRARSPWVRLFRTDPVECFHLMLTPYHPLLLPCSHRCILLLTAFTFKSEHTQHQCVSIQSLFACTDTVVMIIQHNHVFSYLTSYGNLFKLQALRKFAWKWTWSGAKVEIWWQGEQPT